MIAVRSKKIILLIPMKTMFIIPLFSLLVYGCIGGVFTTDARLREDWPRLIFRMVTFGMALQGVVGFLWMKSVGGPATLQICLFITAVLFWTGWKVICGNFAHGWPVLDKWATFVLCLALLSMGLRLIDPLHHSALGQSDAYEHLRFIKAILQKGQLPASYPAGFHWTVVLPVRIFGWDPYEMARFGGAAWGGVLSLGLYVIGTSLRGRKMDGILALMVGTFVPQWYVLTKTGIGMFANQAGLVYLLACWDAIFSQRYWRLGLFSLALLITVPMMLLHFIPFLLILIWIQSTKIPIRIRLGAFSGLVTLGALFIVLLYNWMPGNPTALKMVNQIILNGIHLPGYPQSMPSELHPLVQLVIDYLVIKRVGMANPALFFWGVVFFIGHIGAVVYGLKRRSWKMVLFWAWGSLAGWATLTGSTDFTAYQRSGWEFLMTTAIALGWLGGLISDRLGAKIPCGKLICAGSTVLVAWAFLHPPGHVYPGGQEEEEWIQFTRWVSLNPREAGEILEIPRMENQSVWVITRASTTKPIRWVTNPKIMSWRDINLDTPENYLIQFPQTIKIVLVARKDQKLSGISPVHFQAVSPEYAARYASWLNQYAVLNQKTRDMILGAERWGAEVRKVEWGEALDVYIVDARDLIRNVGLPQFDED